MPYSVRCKACSSSFAIPDEIWDKRVRGRQATLKCRACKADIHVDGTKEGVSQPSMAPPTAPASTPAATAAPIPAPAPLAAAIEATVSLSPSMDSATTTSRGFAVSPPAAQSSPTPPVVQSTTPRVFAKAAQEVSAADVGWSLMPPPGDLEQVGLAPKPVLAPLVAAAHAAIPPGAPAAQPVSVPPISVSPELIDEAPPDPNLWVVSYGENDDRELTEKLIANELIKGHITLSTIVWQEGMDEWLPISGVKTLAKYAPAQKPAPMRQAKPAGAAKATAQPIRPAATPASAAGKAGSLGQRPAPQPREKQPSRSLLDGKSALRTKELEGQGANKPTAKASAALVDAPHPIPTESQPEPAAPKSPPPFTRTEKSSDLKPTAAKGPSVTASAGSRVPSPKAATTHQQGGKPPPLAHRQPSGAKESSPWSDADAAEEVLTSAPLVGVDLQPPAPPQPAPTSAGASPIGVVAPGATPSASGSSPSQRAGAKSSFRPPKPVETATSTVLRTDAAPGKGLLITDDDFLAMQRRFPKWALPAAIAGGVSLIGLIAFASSRSDDPVPLPSAPAADTNARLRENPASQAQPRHPQPNLDALPTAGGALTDEKDFAKLFAQSATKTSGTFDLNAAERSAANVMELAARCRVAPDPSGQARVVVTFSTAGQVLSVQIGSPYANTATGKCVEKALRQIKTRAFQGESGRLPLTVPIH